MSREMKSESSSSSVESGSDDDEVDSENLISSTSSSADDEPTPYEEIVENVYYTDKKKKFNKEVRRMQCDCSVRPDEPAIVGCGDDCLNRLLKIECGSKCRCGDFCTNKAIQRGSKLNLEVYRTDKKGWGLKTLQDIQKNQFVIEYCGEVVDLKTFQKRAASYAKSKQRHYYFMTLNADEIIDATKRGNVSRFINHSCEPNCVTEKWTVKGYLRIGFFALHAIPAGTELTFDYQFQRYGKKAQKCYCGSTNCRGIIGGDKRTPLKRLIAPKKRKRRNIASDLADLTVAEELDRLVGEDRCLSNPDKALQLSQLMVRAENVCDRLEFLQVIQNTTNSSALKAFVKYQGLSLLWSWMVDMGEKSNKFNKQLLLTLKHLPVSNLNQLRDSKIIRAVSKLADSTTNVKSEEEASSSSASPIEIERQDSEMSQDGDREQKEENKMEVDGKETSTEKAAFAMDENTQAKSSDEEGEISDQEEGEITQPDQLSEDSKSDGDEEICRLAEELMRNWSDLKEVYRIPKKVGTPDKRELEPITTAAASSSAPGTPADDEVKNIKWKTASPLSQEKESTISGKNTPDTAYASTANPPSLMSLDLPGAKPLETCEGSSSGMDESPTDGFTKIKDAETPEKAELTEGSSDSPMRPNITQRIMQLASSSVNTKYNSPTIDFASGARHPIPGMMENQFRPRHPGGNNTWNRGRKFRHGAPRQQYPQNIEVIGGVNNSHFMSKMPGPPPPQQWQGQGPFSLQDQAGTQSNMMGPNAPIPPIHGATSHLPQNHFQNQKGWTEPYGQGQSQNFVPPFNNNQPPMKQQFPMFPQFPQNIPNFPPPPNMATPNYPPPPLPTQTQPQNFPNASPSIMLPQVLQNILDSTKIPQGTPEQNMTPSKPPTTQSPAPPPAPKSKSTKTLPSDWKTATDPNGKVYYYHTVTRVTQWDPPTPEDAPSPTDLSESSSRTPESSPKQTFIPQERKKPSTPPGTPPMSPIERYTTAAADTTGLRSADIYQPRQHSSVITSNENRKLKIRETFRTKLSAVVVNCLNPYHKIDCKIGRITTVDDFKYLARKLTHGIMQKELTRISSDDELVCNDSVKIKTKDYIRQYMHKFGSVYKRS